MGILTNDQYWGIFASSLHSIEAKENAYSSQQAQDILRLSCNAFSDLLADAELEADFEKASSLLSEGSGRLRNLVDTGGWYNFVERFKNYERKLLIQSGVDLEATVEILEGIRDMDNYEFSGFENFQSMIENAKDLICRHSKSDVYDNKPSSSLLGDIRTAGFGITIISTNVLAGTSSGDATGMLAGTSISFGFGKTKPLINRVW